jgi:preprotein translocase subunit SecF
MKNISFEKLFKSLFSLPKYMILETYVKKQKKLIIVPIIILIISLFLIFNQYKHTGEFINKDVSLKGGISATLYTEKTVDNLEQKLAEKLNKGLIVRNIKEFGTEKQIGITIESSEIQEDELKKELEDLFNIKLTTENFSIENTSSILGESFYKQMLIAILIAFLLMAIVVLITFKSLIPSLAIVLAAFFDMVVTIAIINLLGISISTAGIAAILLLMGYSIDTDVLLTTKVLKRKEGTVKERVVDSMKTGLTMTITTIIALSVAYFFSASYTLQQMFLIIIIGLFVDVISTYMMNSNILLWYVKKKKNG